MGPEEMGYSVKKEDMLYLLDSAGEFTANMMEADNWWIVGRILEVRWKRERAKLPPGPAAKESALVYDFGNPEDMGRLKEDN